MNTIKLSELLSNVCITRADVGWYNTEINEIKEDSRLVTSGDMFIAMRGYSCDGEEYIAQAISNGAVCIVTESRYGIPASLHGVCFVEVHNVRRACAVIWSNYYKNPERHLSLIGVTGTNGKTTVCRMIKHIFDRYGKKCGIIGTVGNGVGEEVSSSDMTTPAPSEFYRLLDEYRKKGADTVVLEASSHALCQERLAPCTFDVGVLTNITSDHLDFHKTRENYISAKCKLFTQCKACFLNGDDTTANTVAKRVRCKKYFCSLEKTDGIYACNIVDNGAYGSSFFYNGKVRVDIPLAGGFNVMNAVQAIAVCGHFGVPADFCADALFDMPSVKGRCEILRFDEDTAPDFSVMIDFAHTPDALENILKTCRRIAKGRVIAVFGCGGDRDKTKRPEMGRIASRLADLTVITCDNSRTEAPDGIISDIMRGIDKNSHYCIVKNRTDAIRYALDVAARGDIVLLAGKGHEEYEIDSHGKKPYSERNIVMDYLKENNRKGMI